MPARQPRYKTERQQLLSLPTHATAGREGGEPVLPIGPQETSCTFKEEIRKSAK